VKELKHEAIKLSDASLVAMADAMHNKLQKYLEKSASESEYYYYEMSKLFLSVV
jgi:hypothetical protein